MGLGKYLEQIYALCGFYDLILGIAIISLSWWLFDLLGIGYDFHSPFVFVSGSALLVMGVLLLSYSDRARSHSTIGWASVFIRVHYVVMILIFSSSVNYHWLFTLFAISDGLTATILALALVSS